MAYSSKHTRTQVTSSNFVSVLDQSYTRCNVSNKWVTWAWPEYRQRQLYHPNLCLNLTSSIMGLVIGPKCWWSCTGSWITTILTGPSLKEMLLYKYNRLIDSTGLTTLTTPPSHTQLPSLRITLPFLVVWIRIVADTPDDKHGKLFISPAALILK